MTVPKEAAPITLKKQIRVSISLNSLLCLEAAKIKDNHRYPIGHYIDAAIQSYFNQSENGEKSMALILRRLDKLNLSQDACRQDVLISTEALHLFVRVFLTNTAEVARENSDAAEKRGGERMRNFLATLAETIERGGSMDEIKEK